jgi:hypothetical protein
LPWRQIPLRSFAKQQESAYGWHDASTLIDHQLGIDQEPLPAVDIIGFGAVLLPDVAEVVDEPAPIQVVEACARNGLAVVLQAPGLHVEPSFLLIACVAGRGSDPHLCHPGRAALGLVGLVRRILGQGQHADELPFFPEDGLPERDGGRTQMGACDLHHPFFGLFRIAGQAGHDPTALYA